MYDFTDLCTKFYWVLPLTIFLDLYWVLTGTRLLTKLTHYLLPSSNIHIKIEFVLNFKSIIPQ